MNRRDKSITDQVGQILGAAWTVRVDHNRLWARHDNSAQGFAYVGGDGRKPATSDEALEIAQAAMSALRSDIPKYTDEHKLFAREALATLSGRIAA